ncbi:hypothetical protein ABZ656_41720 [Streptomyces sp. NPDC007095]|uniref:hypothetical protein n=1 Tax=Streptomyces sp. NPDC007095 TaxID=3154482 RepID=UPI0026AE4544
MYDLRHTCLTNWLNDGVPPAQVTDWAANGVPVLLSTYARCIVGQLDDLKTRIEAAGDCAIWDMVTSETRSSATISVA